MNKTYLERYLANENTKLIDAMNMIDQNADGVLFVLNEEGKLYGAVSDGDIRRWILGNGVLDTEIKKIMNMSPKYLFEEDRRLARETMERYNVRAIPIVDHSLRVVDMETLKKRKVEETASVNASVIIMAGGQGTRLYPLTKILPKPLIPIGDIPIMERIIHNFCTYGMKDYYITVNYKKNMIKSYFSEQDTEYQLTYVEEDRPLGTAGSIRLIEKKFSDPIFVTNCDILIQADYADIYEYHKKNHNAITIVTSLKNTTIPYGVIHAQEDGQVVGMEEKPCTAYFVNTGMYVIDPALIDLIPADECFHMTDLVEKVLGSGQRVGMYPVSEEAFLDMGEFEEMKRMEERIKQ